MKVSKLLRPQLEGNYWMIGDNPDLKELNGYDKVTNEIVQECVDHHVFKSSDGMWNLWGCIRGTKLGRILYHWKTDSLTKRNWQQTGEILRIDQSYGEGIDDWHGEEWIQSPYIVKHENQYYMFFGGHSSGYDYDGNSIKKYGDSHELLYANTVGQMCLMTSDDGITWTRYKNSEGKSNVFKGPGEVRDPNVIYTNGLWHMYYAGCHWENGVVMPANYVRTSADLLNWSEYKIVHCDINKRFGGGWWDQECPHVVEMEGYYYLFITEDYASGRTHVYRSETPDYFGIGDSRDKYLCDIYAAAPEIIVDDDGNYYITSNHDLRGGTMLCKLYWIED